MRANAAVTTGATASLLRTLHGFSPPLVPVSFVEAPSRSWRVLLVCTRLETHHNSLFMSLQPGQAGVTAIVERWNQANIALAAFFLHAPFRGWKRKGMGGKRD